MRFHLVTLLFLLIPFCGSGKPVEDPKLKMYEDSLQKTGNGIFRGNDQQKFEASQKFQNLLRKALDVPGAYDFPFDSLKMIGNLRAPDNSFRIFNWNLPKDDGTQLYFGYLVVDRKKVIDGKTQPKKDEYDIYELEDKSDGMRGPEMAVLSPGIWYGALYYKIILTEYKSKNYYTLLGWDGNNNQTWKKLIDVLTFQKDGRPVFGEEFLFHTNSRRSSRRVIFEYKAEVVMTLRYDEKVNCIVFDHLAPEVSGADGMYQFYVQSFTYDAYQWKKGKWEFQDNVDVTNPANKNDSKWIKPVGDQDPGKANNNHNNGNPPADPNAKKHGLFHRKKKQTTVQAH